MRCCFIGHSDCENVEKWICKEIKRLIKRGVVEYYTGSMGNFDNICGSVVNKLNGKLIYIPYNFSQIERKTNLRYDKIICPFGNKKYSKFDIPDRNKFMVDSCDICLCYVYKNGGGKKNI